MQGAPQLNADLEKTLREKRILLVHAGHTAYATILAGELGIPCLGGLPNAILGIAAGDDILVDGNSGLVTVNPGRKAVLEFEEQRKRLARRTEAIREKRFERAITVRGKRVKVMANVSSREDVERAVESGADGIGLFRTEGFFWPQKPCPPPRNSAPTLRIAWNPSVENPPTSA